MHARQYAVALAVSALHCAYLVDEGVRDAIVVGRQALQRELGFSSISLSVCRRHGCMHSRAAVKEVGRAVRRISHVLGRVESN